MSRICLLGGPGSGKSTTAAWLFSELKIADCSVELVSEFCKTWAVQNKPIKKWDQVYVFSSQMQQEYQFLSYGVKNIITDSPTLLGAVHGKFYHPESIMWKSILDLNKEYEKDHPSINIFLNRGNNPYIQEGRYQSYGDAMRIDESILNFMNENEIGYKEVNYQNRKLILEIALKNVE